MVGRSLTFYSLVSYKASVLQLKPLKIGVFARAVARSTEVDSGIPADIWKAQTILFPRLENENVGNCLFECVKTVLK